MVKEIIFLAILISWSFATPNDTLIVRLKDIDPTILQDVRYATPNNFTGKILYKNKEIYLRYAVACSLKKVNDYLKEEYGYRLVVFDGYRPLSVQKIMWEIFPNSDYVANPAKGSKHNRGASVDVSIVDKNGQPLDMGTEYDAFRKEAGAYYKNLPKNALKNRKILQEAMTKFGFKVMTSEWWHFDYKDWKRFNIIDYIPNGN
jgi:D-alanyl-D-alanine dipeptidase